MTDTEQSRLAELRALNLLDTPPEERFDRITRFATQLFGVPIATVSLVDANRQWFKSVQGLEVTGSARNDSFCTHTITGDDAMVVEDARRDDRFVDNPFVTGDPHIRFYAGYPLSGPGGHHVGTLCIMDPRPRAFDDRERLVLRDLAQWVEREMAHEEELDRARAVQEALLPRTTPAIAGWDVAGLCLVARSVGGDFFDWSPAAGGAVAVTVADVMGKGMGAAIVMATVRAVLRTGSLDPDPAHAMQTAAVALDADLVSTGAFVTAFTARLQPDSPVVAYVDAGHGLAFVAGDGVVDQLTDGGPPLGAFPDAVWRTGRAEVPPGGTLIVCSDGVLDAFGGDRQALAAIAGAIPPGGAAEEAARTLGSAAQSRGVDDDITVLVARRRS